MLKTFIERPVLSTVISIIIVVLGIIGLATLPVEQYPDIAPPTVQVQANYPGANADVVMNSVVIPLEEQINGVEGMTYMTSSAGNGMAQLRVFFRQGVNPDIAAVNVQNLVARATPLLPQEVTRVGVTVQKQQNSTLLGLTLVTNNPDYDGQFLQNWANINLLPQIKRVYGVGSASVFGARDYSMRIWLNPVAMASYKMSEQEVVAALQDQNIEAAPGEVGQNSNQSFQYVLKFTGKLKSVEEFEDIIIRSQNGQLLRVKDVARVELGSLTYIVSSQTNKKDAVFIQIAQTAGSNAQEVINNVKEVINDANFPPGVEVTYMMDSSEFLDESISKVIHTLFEAFILVFFVVFIFLQDFRSTLIPAIAVPVAIIGTFFFLQVFGFSINLLTLFALVLAIGIVVDDAIVVVEAVHAQLEAGEKDAKTATIKAMTEIAPAIVSITLVMAAVFIPVSFIGGTSGVFFKQFGLTLAIAILISAVNALTLSPALCALFLKAQHKDGNEKHKGLLQSFYYNFNRFFNASTSKYKSSLHFLGKRGHRWITVAIIIVSTVILAGLMKVLPTGLVPNEDSGGVLAFVTLPPGSSLERSDTIVKQIVDIASSIDGVQAVTNITGVNFMAGLGSSYGTAIIKMKPWGERKLSTADVSAILKDTTSHITNASFFFVATPTLQGFGLGAGVEMQLQDRHGGDINHFYNISQNLIAKLQQSEKVMMVMSNFNPNFPQKELVADIPKIKAAGLTLTSVMNTLQVYIGSSYVSTVNLYGKQFRVMVQADAQYRSKLKDLNGITVRTGSGEMAPITEFISINDVSAPQTLNRFNMFQSIDVTIIPNIPKGYGSGDIIQLMEELSKDKTILPDGYSYEYGGMTREEADSGSKTILIFGICLIFVYLLLCALYESYILPLAVIFSLPIGLAGVFVFLMAFGLSYGIVNNIYVQISMIMLIGLLAKNAILIVEYAVQRRQQGMSIIEAAINGAVARLRPILMTSFAFIFGLLPLAMASGAGAIGNKSIGISAIGGMLFGTLIGVLVIPSLYIIFQSIQDKFSKSGFINSNDEVISGKH
ncbi:efflux RND transporter permease subunit [Viscerimonas tarda]